MSKDQLERDYNVADKKARRLAEQKQRCCICGEKIPGKVFVVDAAKGKWACNRCNNERPTQ